MVYWGCYLIIINANSDVDIEDNAIKGISKKAVIKVPKKYLKKYQKEFGKKSGYTKTMKIKAK